MSTTQYDPLVVERAVFKAMAEGGLAPDECRALGASEAVEVSRRLIEIARSIARKS